MKVLAVTPYYHPKIGGLENYARQLNIALHTQEGWEVVIVTSNQEGRRVRIDEVDGMKVYRLGTLFKFSNTPLNPFWPWQIRSIIRREHPDLILAHSPVPSMTDAAALAAGRTPLVVTYHAATLLKGDSTLFNAIARVYNYYQQLTFRRANRILAVSDYVKTALGARFQAKTHVVPNAVWRQEIQLRSRQPADELLFIGSLDRSHAWKGLDQIIDALRIYTLQHGDAIHLTVMGDGNHRGHYEERVKELGLQQKVTFVGAKVGAEKDALIGAASAIVLYPTTANDAFPTVLLEAWAKGVPTIAAAIGPIPSLIHDKQDGFLVAPHDPSALAKTFHEVLAAPAKSRAMVAKAAALRTQEHYTWEQQARTVAAIAKGVVR